MKIVTVVGARPQFIKAATVSRACVQLGVQEVLVHTGQHYDADMSDVFFEQLEIPKPDYRLGIGGGRHGAMTGRQLEKVEEILLAEKPDWVLVYGDTNSTLAGALAAAKLHVSVAHVEAGLRSFNRKMPEEINRVLTDHLATLLFAPTKLAVANLAREGITGDTVRLVGDVMYDATLFFQSKACKPEWFDSLGIAAGEFVLCTIHRAENTDDTARLRGIVRSLGACGKQVILPMHPRTRYALEEIDLKFPPSVHVIAPVGYLEMLWLEMHCHAIATDSGGVQKEAYFHRKRCVTMREETEWAELVDIGANIVVGTDPAKLALAIAALEPLGPSIPVGLYGDGLSSTRIVRALLSG